MNRGIYPALAGAITFERRLEILSHNVGNVHTTGYKKDEPIFGTMLARAGGQPVAGIDLFPHISTIRPDHSQGPLRNTGHSMDIALEGKGFLVVSTPAGLRHFRGGQLHRNQEGQLVTHTGDVLVGKKGPIKLPPGNMTIEQDGSVRVNNAVVDTLRLEQVPESVNTVKSGDLFWHIPKEAETAEDLRVHQGKIEKSNVKPGVDLMELIKVTRGYEQMQKAIRTMDELTAQVIQTARVQG